MRQVQTIKGFSYVKQCVTAEGCVPVPQDIAEHLQELEIPDLLLEYGGPTLQSMYDLFDEIVGNASHSLPALTDAIVSKVCK